MLVAQLVVLALDLALESAGKSIAAKMAMMAITTNNSMRVNAPPGLLAEGRTWTSFAWEPQFLWLVVISTAPPSFRRSSQQVSSAAFKD
jgi:hypothetical protein